MMATTMMFIDGDDNDGDDKDVMSALSFASVVSPVYAAV